MFTEPALIRRAQAHSCGLVWYHHHRISRCWEGEHPQRGAVPHPVLRTRTCTTALGCAVRCGRTGLLGGTVLSQALQTPSATNRAPPPSKNQMPPPSHREKKKKSKLKAQQPDSFTSPLQSVQQ